MDRVDTAEVHRESHNHGSHDHRVEAPRLPEGLAEPLFPAERIGQGVRGRARQHGDGEHPGPDDPEREEQTCEAPGHRRERTRRFRCRVHVRDPRGVQGGCRRHHDREHHDHGRGHPRRDVSTHGLHVTAIQQGSWLGPQFLFLFDLFARLPEEQVRRDRGSQDGDDRRELGSVHRRGRDERRP